MERLYESAEVPLERSVPIETISIALRTFSYLHSLSVQVATRVIVKLYSLPHMHHNNIPTLEPRISMLDGVPYTVPPPSSLDWIEEQRLLQAAFQLRSYGLLGIAPPPANTYGDRPDEPFSNVNECRHFFDAHLPDMTSMTVPRQVE